MDNGQIWFDHVRVPRDALLDRYASIAADGTYSSPIPSVAQRFGTMVGGLTTGTQPSPPASQLRFRRSKEVEVLRDLYVARVQDACARRAH